MNKQIYIVLYKGLNTVRGIGCYFTTEESKILEALAEDNHVFTIPQWEEIKDAKVILKKVKKRIEL